MSEIVRALLPQPQQVGWSDVLDGISWQKCTNATVRSRLKGLNELRNRIVHGGTETVGKWQVEHFKAFVENLAIRLDRKVATVVRSVTGVAPWYTCAA